MTERFELVEKAILKMVEDKIDSCTGAAVVYHTAIKPAFQIVLKQLGPAKSVGIPGKAGSNRSSVLNESGAAHTVGDGISQKLDADSFLCQNKTTENLSCFCVHKDILQRRCGI